MRQKARWHKAAAQNTRLRYKVYNRKGNVAVVRYGSGNQYWRREGRFVEVVAHVTYNKKGSNRRLEI